MKEHSMNNEQWLAIKNCDKSYDGKFFYALKTTKIVCKPSCPARTPKPKNIEIYISVDEAKRNGYRPCLRCRPEQPDWKGYKVELAIKAKEYINKHFAEKLSAKTIGIELFIDPFHLHRVFKENFGLSIPEYQHKVRINKAKQLLEDTNLSLSFISSDIGYNSLSHFSRVFKNHTNYSPSKYRTINRKK